MVWSILGLPVYSWIRKRMTESFTLVFHLKLALIICVWGKWHRRCWLNKDNDRHQQRLTLTRIFTFVFVWWQESAETATFAAGCFWGVELSFQARYSIFQRVILPSQLLVPSCPVISLRSIISSQELKIFGWDLLGWFRLLYIKFLLKQTASENIF